MNQLHNLHLPVLSGFDIGICRSPGPGLGNLLFPISRALIGQKHHGGHFVYPTMRQVKIGTFLRQEKDKRTYGDVLRSRSWIEWRRWLAARSRPAVDEGRFDGSQRGVTVRYAGLGRYFHDLQGHEDLIERWLSKNVRDRTSTEPFDIGIHVRLGDFAIADPTCPSNSIRQPFEWYRAAFDEARHLLGTRTPSSILFTDSESEQVTRDLGIEPLAVDDGANALTAIQRLSRARVLIASRSTFSMWAAFLGRMPVIWDRHYDDRIRSLPYRPGLDHVV